MRVLCTGQSNAIGRGIKGPDPTTANPKVTVWNNQNEVDSAGTQFIAPPTFANNPWSSNGGNNFGLWFCDRAAKELREDIRYTLVADGGESIAAWDKATGFMYARMVSVFNAQGQEPADVLLWHQGENDGGVLTTAQYKAAFLDVIANFRADGLLAADAPVITGELSELNDPANADINLAFTELAAEDPLTYFALADGLQIYDGVHYTGASLYAFGRFRYWDKYREHIGFPRFQGDVGFGLVF